MNLLDLFIDYKVIDAKLKPEEKLESKRFDDLFTVYSPKFPKQEEKPIEKSEQSSEEPKTDRMSIEERINYFKSRKDKKQNNISEEDTFDLNGYLGHLEREYGSEGQNRYLPKWTPFNDTIFTDKILKIQNGNKSNYKHFREQLELYANEHDIDSETVDILDAIVGLESSYDMKASNSNSSALGWFQFLDNTRSQYTKLNRDQFVKDPQAQIDAAVKHYKYLQNRLKKVKNIYNIQLTPLQKMYAAWWNPGSLENYYRTGADDFQTNSDKMDLYKIIKKAS